MKNNDFGYLKTFEFRHSGCIFCVPPPGSPDFCADPRWIPLDTGFELLFCVPPTTKNGEKGPNVRPQDTKGRLLKPKCYRVGCSRRQKRQYIPVVPFPRVPRRAPMCTRRVRNVASWSPIRGGCTATLFKLNLAVRTTVASIFWTNPLHKAGGRRPPLFRPCIYIYISF